MGIILISWENLKPSEKYHPPPTPQKKSQSTRKNLTNEKVSTTQIKASTPFSWKILNPSRKKT